MKPCYNMSITIPQNQVITLMSDGDKVTWFCPDIIYLTFPEVLITVNIPDEAPLKGKSDTEEQKTTT